MSARAYFVSARNGSRSIMLAGPFGNHDQALAKVDACAAKARAIDPGAHWYSYGTCSVSAEMTHEARVAFPEMTS